MTYEITFDDRTTKIVEAGDRKEAIINNDPERVVQCILVEDKVSNDG